MDDLYYGFNTAGRKEERCLLRESSGLMRGAEIFGGRGHIPQPPDVNDILISEDEIEPVQRYGNRRNGNIYETGKHDVISSSSFPPNAQQEYAYAYDNNNNDNDNNSYNNMSKKKQKRITCSDINSVASNENKTVNSYVGNRYNNGAGDAFSLRRDETSRVNSAAQSIRRERYESDYYTWNPETCEYEGVREDMNAIGEMLREIENDRCKYLKPIDSIPKPFDQLFSQFPVFNYVQSSCFDTLIESDDNFVLSAPTGSGKTVIFEFAIIRALMNSPSGRIIYVSPIKALCSERFHDWSVRFAPMGFKCAELTGDTDDENYFAVKNANIILTTPEKWDSMTRKWRDINAHIIKQVCLFMIDEVHILNDGARGATLEAVVSRMKTIQSGHSNTSIRFVAVSATIPNVEDIATWLRSPVGTSAQYLDFDDTYRPVPLQKIVLSYPENHSNAYMFDNNLNYKLLDLIQGHSENKPTLVFCNTRKSTQQAALKVSKDAKALGGSLWGDLYQQLSVICGTLHDKSLKECVSSGVAFHHAGLDASDRRVVEKAFQEGKLPVLFSTSTLAMGVNLPAHLVILKTTQYYDGGVYTEYPELQVLQMIGRAGRPQFDTSAKAIIMTKDSTKTKYENLVGGLQTIESNLHRNLIEHLNAEIVLKTITNSKLALDWFRFSFFFVRVLKNPAHYGIPANLSQNEIEERISKEIIIKNVNLLCEKGMATHELQADGPSSDILKASEAGSVMAKFCVKFSTMNLLIFEAKDLAFENVLSLVAQAEEFSDIRLRVNEKKALNNLNASKENHIRFPIKGKIKTARMKIECLFQAALGCMAVTDFSLAQDTKKIFQVGERVLECAVDYYSQRQLYKPLRALLLMRKCVKLKLWENSPYFTKQLEKVGNSLSALLAKSGIKSWKDLVGSDPRHLESIVNRNPPFGNQLLHEASKVPFFCVKIEKGVIEQNVQNLSVVVTLEDVPATKTFQREQGGSSGKRAKSFNAILLIGDSLNNVLTKRSFSLFQLKRDGAISFHCNVNVTEVETVYINVLYEAKVGLDYFEEICFKQQPVKKGNAKKKNPKKEVKKLADAKPESIPKDNAKVQPTLRNDLIVIDDDDDAVAVPCLHSCANKMTCGHLCCKNGKRKGKVLRPNDPLGTLHSHFPPTSTNSLATTLKKPLFNKNERSTLVKGKEHALVKEHLQNFALQRQSKETKSKVSKFQFKKLESKIDKQEITNNIRSAHMATSAFEVPTLNGIPTLSKKFDSYTPGNAANKALQNNAPPPKADAYNNAISRALPSLIKVKASGVDKCSGVEFPLDESNASLHEPVFHEMPQMGQRITDVEPQQELPSLQALGILSNKYSTKQILDDPCSILLDDF
eukprot:Nk52_evm6s210 gene=Nk52_evmTU6s210